MFCLQLLSYKPNKVSPQKEPFTGTFVGPNRVPAPEQAGLFESDVISNCPWRRLLLCGFLPTILNTAMFDSSGDTDAVPRALLGAPCWTNC